MDIPKPGGCPRCAELEKKTANLTAHVEKLEADLARAKKNSSTSSKPPSSDIVKPPKPAPKGKGKRKQEHNRDTRVISDLPFPRRDRPDVGVFLDGLP